MLQWLLLFPLIACADEFGILEGHERWVLALAVSPDGKYLASGSDDKTVRLWELSADGKSRILRKCESPVTALAFSKDSNGLAIGTWDGTLLLCDAKDGEVLKAFRGHKETINVLVFDPSGAYLASGSADDRLIVWDAATAEDLLTMQQGNEYDVTTAAFSPDGKRIVTGDGENQLKIWDADTGGEIETLVGHSEPVTCSIFDVNGNLISGSWDDTIRIWREGEDLILRGHSGDITALVVDNARGRIFSASEDKTVQIWNAGTGELERTLLGHNESIRSLAISPDGKRLFSGSKHSIRSWNVHPE